MCSIRPVATGSPLTSSVASPPVAGFGASAVNTSSIATSPVGSGSSAACVYTNTPSIE